MGKFTESAAERLIADRSFECGPPGFVGAAIDLPRRETAQNAPQGREEPAIELSGREGVTTAPSGRQAAPSARPNRQGPAIELPGREGASAAGVRRTLRHGFLVVRAGGVVTVSGPPSPGLESCLARMSDDLGALPVAGPDRSAVTGIRVGLEAGLDGGGPLGLARRWRLAHTLAPVLAAAFANSPVPGEWRSVRAARHRGRPVLPGPPDADPVAAPATVNLGATTAAAVNPCTPDLGGIAPLPAGPDRCESDPRASWTAYVMAEPSSGGHFASDAASSSERRSFREWTRSDDPPTEDDLARHLAGLRPPVAARGHLELDFADGQSGDGWRVAVAVIATLLDDPVAATVAEGATGRFAYGERVWERAARDALADAELAAAARECFLAAYAALARRGAPRELRDAVAAFMESYVLRGRCPADDRLSADRTTPAL
jgi:glutamate--cysteine ligase